MVIALVQPFGLDDPGGGSRILRSLIAGLDEPFISISTGLYAPKPTSLTAELHIPPRPYFGRIERTRFHGLPRSLSPLFESRLQDQLQQALIQHGVQKVHVVPHELDFWSTLQVARQLKLPYYLSVHDHILTSHQGLQKKRALAYMAEAWQNADGISVISETLGQEYCRLFGERSSVVITDGWSTLPTEPQAIRTNSLAVYFMGLVHYDYRENFRAFSEALDIVQRLRPNLSASFAIRGSTDAKFFQGVNARLLPWSTASEVDQDFLAADVLYMPLSFDAKRENFTRFSLSTKMVSYLATGLPIIYHGPQYAEACRLLREFDAAIIIDSLDPEKIAQMLIEQIERRGTVVTNALKLAEARFKLTDQQSAFRELISIRKSHH